jgi:hypothetical protein
MDYWPLLEAPPRGTDIAVVTGGRSDRWGPEARQRLRAAAEASAERARAAVRRDATAPGRLFAFELPRAGHWLHVDDGEGLQALLAPRLRAGAMA